MSSPAHDGSEAGWQRTLWLMVAVQAIMSLAFQTSAPFLPLYIIELGVHPLARVDLWAGATASVGFLFAALFSPIWGSLADRFGRKAMVVRSCVAVSLFTALAGLAPNVWLLFAARACMGIFSGFSAAATALVGTQVPEDRLGFSLGWMATGQLVGGLLGPIVGGVLADRLHDYRIVFFWTAAVALIAALTCASLVHERFVRAPAAAKGGASLWERVRELTRHPQLAPMFLVVLLAQVSALGVQPIVPLFVRALVGNAPWLATAAGAAFAVTGAADILASPWLGKRSDRIGYRRVLLISLAGVALFTIPQSLVHTIWAFLALRFGVGVFLGGVLPTANAWIGSMFPVERRGQVYGIVSSATFLGMFAGPLLGGAVASRFGFAAVFVTIGMLTLANLAWVATSVRGSAAAQPKAA
ncbi:MAG TPA: MFS transporter [Candidatus Limnocylindria bacterium]|nr:MFS transporter [Candidatus Limnocylindria bacterium]